MIIFFWCGSIAISDVQITSGIFIVLHSDIIRVSCNTKQQKLNSQHGMGIHFGYVKSLLALHLHPNLLHLNFLHSHRERRKCSNGTLINLSLAIIWYKEYFKKIFWFKDYLIFTTRSQNRVIQGFDYLSAARRTMKKGSKPDLMTKLKIMIEMTVT